VVRTVGESLSSRTVAGLRWTYAATMVGVVLQLVYMAVMGRLLRPADFGLVAMATVLVRFGTYFAQMGVGPALIQKPELTERDIRVAFTSSLLLGVACTAVLIAVAPLAADFYGAPAVTPVLRVLALSFLLTGLGLTAVNLLRRRLRFRALGLATVISNAVGFIGVGVVAAVLGAGVWSLVAATLATVTLKSVFALVAARHALVPLLAGPELRRLFSFGGRVSVISIMEYLGINLDTLAIGRYANQELLGQYNRALMLIHVPLWNVTMSLSQVLFPAMSRVQAEPPRVRRAYLEALAGSAALILPVTAGVAVASTEMVATVLGSQWGLAATVLPIICATSAVRLLTHFGGIVCEALGALNRKMALEALYLVVLVALLGLAVGGDLTHYALAVLGSEVFRHVGYMLFMRRLLDIPVRRHLTVYVAPLAAAGLVAAAIAAVTYWARALAMPAPGAFVLQVLAGGVALTLAAAFGPLRGVRSQVRERLQFAGVLEGPGRVQRLLRRLLGVDT
jgi:lipopolysaccharide exporter